jgi:hypothetical protein
VPEFEVNPYIFAALLAVGLLVNWLARTIYKNKPAGCKWITIAIALLACGGLLFFLVLLYLFEKGVLK